MPFFNPHDPDLVMPLGSPAVEAREASPKGAAPVENRLVNSPTWSIELCLAEADEKILGRIRHLLTQHLGSDVAAIAWLNSPSTGYPGTALDAIRQGHAAVVLEDVESQRGPGPSYA